MRIPLNAWLWRWLMESAVFIPALAGAAVLIPEYIYFHSRPLEAVGAPSPLAVPSIRVRVAMPVEGAMPVGEATAEEGQALDVGMGETGFGHTLDTEPAALAVEPEPPPRAGPETVGPTTVDMGAAVDFWRREGYAAYLAGYWRRAERAYRRARVLSPDDEVARGALAILSASESGRVVGVVDTRGAEGEGTHGYRHGEAAGCGKGNKSLLANCLFNRAVLAEERGDRGLALRLYGQAARVWGDFHSGARSRAGKRYRQLWRSMAGSNGVGASAREAVRRTREIGGRPTAARRG